jgi:hypothetical protein
MLPDLAAMAGGRVRELRSAELAAGVAFHHVTDRVFHASSTFRALELAACAELTEAGFPRGSARALGHVANEILIDGLLLLDRAVGRDYLLALAAGARAASLIEWANRDEAEGFAVVVSVLTERELAIGDMRPAALVRRLRRILQHRPRLAFDDRLEPALGAWLLQGRERVAETLDALLRELEAGLVMEGYPPLFGAAQRSLGALHAAP